MKIPREIAVAAIGLLQPYTERVLTIEELEEFLHRGNFLPPSAEEILLTRNETAKALHVSLPTVDRMVKAGELRRVKVRGRIMIQQSEIDKILKNGQQ